MARERIPGTAAMRAVRELGIAIIPRFHRYQGGGGVVMNGPFETSTKELGRHLGKRRVAPCAVARRAFFRTAAGLVPCRGSLAKIIFAR